MLQYIGRFTGIDPIADEFAWVSGYNYAENMVPMAIDLWGLQSANPPEPGTRSNEYWEETEGGYIDKKYGGKAEWNEEFDTWQYTVKEGNQIHRYILSDEGWELVSANNSPVQTGTGEGLSVNPNYVADYTWENELNYSAWWLFQMAAVPLPLGGAAEAGGIGLKAWRIGRVGGGVAKLAQRAERGTAARLSTNGIKLSQQIASEAQMSEIGIIIVRNLRSGRRLAQQYGGKATDWVKKTSSSFSKNGKVFETHWYENLSTGQRVEFKTKLIQGW